MYVCVYVCTFVFMCMRASCTLIIYYLSIGVCDSVHMYVCMYGHINVCIWVYKCMFYMCVR